MLIFSLKVIKLLGRKIKSENTGIGYCVICGSRLLLEKKPPVLLVDNLMDFSCRKRKDEKSSFVLY